jgi:PAS domain S-box-containing protein
MSTMKASPRDTSSPTSPFSLPHPLHSVQFYQEDRSLIEELTRLVGSALLNGDAALIVATKPHRDAIASELAARDFNIARASAEGRYVALDAAETLSRFMVDKLPVAGRFNEVVGHLITKAKNALKVPEPHIVIFGEMVALLCAEGNYEGALRLEELWNALADKHSFSLRCAYPMSGFQHDAEGEFFSKICGEHSAVAPVVPQGIVLSDDEQLRIVAKLQQQLEVLEHEKALRASEQRFRLLVEAAQDYAIFMLDADGRVSSWNIGAKRIKGYEPSEIIGQHFSRFYPEVDVQAGKPQRELQDAMRDGRVEDEGWRVRKDGSRFWANVVITALRGEQGQLLGFSKVTRDFTERMQTEQALRDSKEKLQESEKSLRELSLHLLRTQDEERRRIGRDLHDSLGQYLTALKIRLDAFRSAAARKQAPDVAELSECSELTNDAIKEVRTISYLMYPPMLDEMGLKSAIPWYLEGFTQRSGIKTAFEAPPEFPRLAPEVELALFRVLQESLTNVHRHSGSPTARVRLTVTDKSAVLEISDQGKGTPLRSFSSGAPGSQRALGVGLRGMNERILQIGGALELSSSEKGTTVSAIIPLNEALPAPEHTGQGS